MTSTTAPAAIPSTAGTAATASGGISLQALAERVGQGVSFSDVVRITDALHTIGALARWTYAGRVFVRRLVAEGRKGR